jgi:membrane protein
VKAGMQRIRKRFAQVSAFFAETVWRVDVARLSRMRVLGYEAARVLYASWRSLSHHDIPSRAAALTFYTVLALVPLLALGFSTLKGLGGYSEVFEATLLPRVRDAFAGNPLLLQGIETILRVVEETNFGSLGVLGLVVVVYTAVILLAETARAFNAIWAAAPRRTLVRQLTDLVALIVLAPIVGVVVLSLAATTVAATTPLIQYVREALGLGFFIDLVLRTVPIFVLWVALSFVYLLIPNTRTRVRSVLIGAAVGAVLWQGALVLHVQFQMGVARYSAIYSGFAAIPIFLFWVYVSWILVLLGAIVAASHQHRHLLAHKVEMESADEVYREVLALEIMARVGHAFLSGRGGRAPWSLDALATELDAPDQVVDEVLEALATEGLVFRAGEGAEALCLLARSPDGVRVGDVLQAVRHHHHPRGEIIPLEEGRSAAVREVVLGLRNDVDRSRYNWSVQELAQRLGR